MAECRISRRNALSGVETCQQLGPGDKSCRGYLRWSFRCLVLVPFVVSVFQASSDAEFVEFALLNVSNLSTGPLYECGCRGVLRDLGAYRNHYRQHSPLSLLFILEMTARTRVRLRIGISARGY